MLKSGAPGAEFQHFSREQYKVDAGGGTHVLFSS